MWNNSCEFIGRLGKDPESATSKGGKAYTKFSIAVNKLGDKEAKPLWVNVVVFGTSAEYAAKYLAKGNQVIVRGELELQEYEGNDGKTRQSLSLIARDVGSLTPKAEGEPQAQAASASASGTKTVSAPVGDEDIPF